MEISRKAIVFLIVVICLSWVVFKSFGQTNPQGKLYRFINLEEYDDVLLRKVYYNLTTTRYVLKTTKNHSYSHQTQELARTNQELIEVQEKRQYGEYRLSLYDSLLQKLELVYMPKVKKKQRLIYVQEARAVLDTLLAYPYIAPHLEAEIIELPGYRIGQTYGAYFSIKYQARSKDDMFLEFKEYLYEKVLVEINRRVNGLRSQEKTLLKEISFIQQQRSNLPKYDSSYVKQGDTIYYNRPTLASTQEFQQYNDQLFYKVPTTYHLLKSGTLKYAMNELLSKEEYNQNISRYDRIGYYKVEAYINAKDPTDTLYVDPDTELCSFLTRYVVDNDLYSQIETCLEEYNGKFYIDSTVNNYHIKLSNNQNLLLTKTLYSQLKNGNCQYLQTIVTMRTQVNSHLQRSKPDLILVSNALLAWDTHTLTSQRQGQARQAIKRLKVIEKKVDKFYLNPNGTINYDVFEEFIDQLDAETKGLYEGFSDVLQVGKMVFGEY